MPLARSARSIRSGNSWTFAKVLSASIEEIGKALIVCKHLVCHRIEFVHTTIASLGPACVQSNARLG